MTRGGERGVFVAGVALLWGFFVAMAALSPITLDDWYAVAWHRQHDFTAGNVLEYARYNYFNYNPRPGDTLLLLVNGPVLLHLVITPLTQLLLLVVVTTLAFGRWPRADRRGLAELVVVQALIWLCIPTPGAIYFYRPFATNYLFASCFQLLLFVPFRLELAGPRGGRARLWLAPLLLAWGVLAGMTNEHTGPSAIVTLVAIIAWAARAGRLRAWMVTAAVGLVAGYALLYFAPGHTVRYAGLANDISPLATLKSRGVLDCLRIVGAVIAEAQPGLIGVVALAMYARRRDPAVDVAPGGQTLATMVAAIVCAGMITVTTFASPIVEDRVMLASCLLLVIALAAACAGPWRVPAACAALVGGAVVVVLLHVVGFLVIYRGLRAESDARVAALARAAPGDVVEVAPTRWPRRDHWVYGEDFQFAYMREFVAHRVFDVGRLELAPLPSLGQPTPPERMAVVVQYDPPLDARVARPAWPLWSFVPTQWAWVVREIRETHAYLDGVPGHRLRAIDVTVQPATSGLGADRPIYLVRWQDGGFARIDARAHADADGFTFLSLADPSLPLVPTQAWLSACGTTRPLDFIKAGGGLAVPADLYCSGNHTVYVCDAAVCWLAGRYW